MCVTPDFELPRDIELAFIALHGTFGEDGQVQKILEERGVAYTGEGVAESRARLRQDSLEGEISMQHGVTTPDWEIIDRGPAADDSACRSSSKRRARVRPSAFTS